MESNNVMDLFNPSAEEDVWGSPVDAFTSNHRNEKRIVMSTPNVALQYSTLLEKLENSEGSTRQDSGFCTLTPQSTTPYSDGEVLSTSPHCRKLFQCGSYESCTPSKMFSCQKKHLNREQGYHSDYMKTISENRTPSTSHFVSKMNLVSRCNEIYYDIMDTSLYPDELDLETHQDEGNPESNFQADSMDIWEEKSIDFVDSGICVKTDSKLSNEIKNYKRSELKIRPNDLITEHGESDIVPNLDNRKTFSSTANKVVTMKRVVKHFLNGIETIDIPYMLTNKINCPHIVTNIFSYLSDKDLDAVNNVSKTWRGLLYKDSIACKRWKDYRTVSNLRKENQTSPTKDHMLGRQIRAWPVSPLTNRNREVFLPSSPNNSPPVSPGSVRFQSFHKAAKTLKKGERLLACPRCYFPSTDHGSPTVQCSRSGCRHRFCVWCRNEITSGNAHNCPPLYSPKRQRGSSCKIAAVGSKTCKRKLRRLTLT